MEAVSMKCPNCMGDVIPYGNGKYGRCNSCDSVFKLRDDVDEEAYDEDEFDDEEDDDEAFDFEEFFNDAYDTYVDDPDDLSDCYFGERLADNGYKKDAAIKHFDIGEDDEDEIWCIVDTTIFGSCKVGFAMTTSGIYFVDEDSESGFIDWDEFDKGHITRDGGAIKFCGHKFILSSDEARILVRILRDLQE